LGFLIPVSPSSSLGGGTKENKQYQGFSLTLGIAYFFEIFFMGRFMGRFGFLPFHGAVPLSRVFMSRAGLPW
jgi:hypothetical protein